MHFSALNKFRHLSTIPNVLLSRQSYFLMLVPEERVEELTRLIEAKIYSTDYVYRTLDDPVYGSALKSYVVFELFPEDVIKNTGLNEKELTANKFYWMLKWFKLYLITTNGKDLIGITDGFANFFEREGIDYFDELADVEDIVDENLEREGIIAKRFMSSF